LTPIIGGFPVDKTPLPGGLDSGIRIGSD
jgi:hypothetical protein